ncbi:Ankyrin-2 [Ananas comosus]|uniref:Ankyrin-2 n=1 Tax=Ananas comosus TaxID=4615 RepID=A0A199V735_ANACO|nr:Ankyrin-2 [Ananas comosus]
MGNPSRRGSARGGGAGESEIHAAARSGDLRTVESICNSNPLAINSRDRHSRTPLHLAAWAGQTEVVSYLCKHKADVGAAAMDDTGAIHFASQKGHTEVVRVLLSAGVSIKAGNRKGMTPLHYAAQGSQLELVKYLVRKGADIKSKTKGGQTPLNLAENEEVCAFLKECEQSLKKGSELNPSKKADESVSESSGKDNEAGEKKAAAMEKRKGEEINEESFLEPKKAKVSLEHLINENDEQDAEE